MVQVVVPNPNFAIRADSVNQLEPLVRKITILHRVNDKNAVFSIQAIKARGLVLHEYTVVRVGSVGMLPLRLSSRASSLFALASHQFAP